MPCLNGVFDLAIGEFRSTQPDDYLTLYCPTMYDPNADDYCYISGSEYSDENYATVVWQNDKQREDNFYQGNKGYTWLP